MVRALKIESSWDQMRNLDRAAERVNSWPEWKRTAFSYRRRDETEDSSSTQVACSQKTGTASDDCNES